VRNLSFGGNSTANQDPRASVAKANVNEPTLLFTFLGRVSSRNGREFERVLTVKTTREGGTMLMTTASEWAALADPGKAVRTTGIWDEFFKDWHEQAQDRATKSAAAGFKPLAEQFTDERSKSLKSENNAQKEWLKKRAEEITGSVVSVSSRQGQFFGSDGDEGTSHTSAAEWASITDPSERLAAFKSDRAQRPSQRSEAEGVLRIYQQRTHTLERLMDLRPPEVVLLGVLMLVPEVNHGS